MDSKYISLILAIVLAIISTVTSQSISWGKCTTTLPVMKNFDIEQFVGVWFEEWRVYHLPEAPYQCVWNEVIHDVTPGNYNFSVYGGWTVFGKRIQTKIGGHITQSPEANSKWIIHMAWFAPADPYWILETDYTTYAVAFSCEQKGPFKLETAWIMRRDPIKALDTALVKDLKDFFVYNDIDYSKKWQLVNNSKCNYTIPTSPTEFESNL